MKKRNMGLKVFCFFCEDNFLSFSLLCIDNQIIQKNIGTQ